MADDIFLLLRVVFCLGPALEKGLIISGDIICCLEVLGIATVGEEVKWGDGLMFCSIITSFSSRASSGCVEGGGVVSVFSLSKFNSLPSLDCDGSGLSVTYEDKNSSSLNMLEFKG